MNKRVRSSNFTEESSHHMVDLIDKHLSVIGNKRTDSEMRKKKRTAWKLIADEFNATAIYMRTPEQLKQKYESLRKEVRKKIASQQMSPQQFAGVRLLEENSVPSVPLLVKVQRMMELSPEEFAIMQCTESTDSSDIQIRQHENSGISEADEGEDDNDVIEVIGSAVSDDGCEAVIPSGSERITLDERSERQPVNHESFSTQGACGDQINADHSRKRKKPECNKSSSKHLFKCRNLRSWVLAREELISLQKDLLLKEFKEREKRERELHQVNVLIKKVQLRNEELENQIKVQKLRKLVQDNQDLEMDTQWK